MINTPLTRWCSLLLALVAGALLPLSMAPWNLWGLAVFSLAALAWVFKQNSTHPFLPAFCYGLGLFGAGASWVFVSIYTYGNTGLILAVLMTLAFVAALAAIFSAPWMLLRFGSASGWRFVLLFTALWTLNEWLRGWFLTGFPWLYVGYGQLNSPLAGWIPLIGVLGAGLLLAFSAAPLSIIADLKSRSQIKKFCFICLPLLILIWGGGAVLRPIDWTSPINQIEVSLVQPNIPVEEKWNPARRQQIIDQLMQLTEDSWGTDLLIWPEAALPLITLGQSELIEQLNNRATMEGTAMMTGRLIYNASTSTYHNSLLAIGEASGDYHKQRLVPFGEYVPLEKYLRGLIDFFDLPNSVISVGSRSDPLQIGDDYQATAAICYEIAYADLVARNTGVSNLIVTVSNDAWFGKSIGPAQHLQIARARAMENQKPVARGTNNGYSALIDAHGNELLRTDRFVSTTVHGNIELREGSTLFSRTGTWPILIIAVALYLTTLKRFNTA